MSLDVTVSIVNWNTRDELRHCLDSVLAQQGVAFEVVVSDNASSDGSADLVRSDYADRVSLVLNDSNLGFGAAHNAVMRVSESRYTFLLNPDCRIPEPDALYKMVAYCDTNPDIALLGPRILNPDGSLQYSARRFPKPFAAVFRHTVLGRLFPDNHFVREYMMTDWSHDEVRDVDWLSGAALLARREAYKRIGLLDERFFMYVEDVDWCRRAHEAGWRVVYYPLTAIVHRIGSASDQNPVPMIRQHHRSMLRYFLKHNARKPSVLLTPIVMLGLWIRQRSLIRRTRVQR